MDFGKEHIQYHICIERVLIRVSMDRMKQERASNSVDRHGQQIGIVPFEYLPFYSPG